MLPLAFSLPWVCGWVGIFFEGRLVIVIKLIAVDRNPSCEGQGVIITSHVNSLPPLPVTCIAYVSLT